MGPRQAVDEDRLSTADDVAYKLEDRLEEGGELSIESPHDLPSPKCHIKDEVVERSFVEALNVGCAVDDGRYSSSLEARQIPGCL